ncbi:inner membrane protein [Escherichia coli]|nr:inner membrane protein [Escherichia coli]
MNWQIIVKPNTACLPSTPTLKKALPPLLVRQQKAVDLITQCYQQMHMLSAQNNTDYKRMLRIFQEALDLQEHISVSLHQPEEVQKLVERSHAEEVIRWNAQTVAARLRVLADDILYHRLPTRFTMEKQIGALEKIARQHPDNPVGQFCYWHFSRIARVLRTQKPLYARDLLADKQRRMPLLPALKSYLSLKSPALRNAGRLSVMLSVASLMGTALHLPKSYWILMTVLLVTQNGYGATRLRIVNRSVGTVVGLIIAGVALHFKIPRRLHPDVDADYHPRQLPDIAQKLRLGDGRFYYYRSVYPATIVVERRAIHPSASYRYHYWLFNCFRRYCLAVAAVAERVIA